MSQFQLYFIDFSYDYETMEKKENFSYSDKLILKGFKMAKLQCSQLIVKVCWNYYYYLLLLLLLLSLNVNEEKDANGNTASAQGSYGW